MTLSDAAAWPREAGLASEALAQLDRPIEPVPVAPLYRLGLAVVAVLMVVLPLVYVGLIGLVGYLLYQHIAYDTVVFEEVKSARAAFVLYVAPIVVGGLLLLFMVKPLFARRARPPALLALDPASQPLLFEFVNRLCAAVGAPRPREINVDCEVNASASLRRGLWSLIGNDLRLTIGLPLAAGLTLRQFVGVLAHEFGHFAQGSALRLTYIIRAVNAWLARVVYERDAWDERLAAWSQEGGWITLVLWVARAFIWITRRNLWCLMWVGHLVSCFMLRQMEFDADRYEARVAGSGNFAQTCRRLPVLGVGAQNAFVDLDTAWREGRLCDDLPALMLANANQLTAEQLERIEQMVSQTRTGFFDTHPADADRIASAAAENAAGIFTADGPATALFRDFAGLCKSATAHHYRKVVGVEVSDEQLVPTRQVVEGVNRQIDHMKVLGRLVQGHLLSVRPYFPLGGGRGADPAEDLIAARNRQIDAMNAMPLAISAMEQADQWATQIRRVEAMRSAGVKRVRASDFGMQRADEAEIHLLRQEVAGRTAQAAACFDQLERCLADRIAAAVALAEREGLWPEPPAPATLLSTLEALKGSLEYVEALLHLSIELVALFERIEYHEESQTYMERIRSLGTAVSARLESLRSALAGRPYPFDHVRRDMTLGEFLVPAIPGPEDFLALGEAMEVAINHYHNVYLRVMGELAALVERVETHIGLPPLPDPDLRA